MRLIRYLFGKLINNKIEEPTEKNEYVIQLLELQTDMDKILSADKYIAKSEYLHDFSKYKSVVDFFVVLNDSGMMSSFCVKNGIKVSDVKRCLEAYSNLEKYINQHNDDFISRRMIGEKEYLDNILKSVDPQISLDEDQRRVILTDEDYCLVIAGAGAGKTTTVAAKVKYLVEKNNINPEHILVVSFTNKAVNELKEKINDELKIGCPIATFHSTGNAIIHKNAPDEKLKIYRRKSGRNEEIKVVLKN